MPTLIAKTESYIITTDPNDHFPNTQEAELLNATGYLLGWAVDYFAGEKAATTLKAHMEQIYGFGDLIPMKLTLHSDDRLSYPGDPDLHPIVIIEQPVKYVTLLRCLIYTYGIVVFVEGDETFITRMD